MGVIKQGPIQLAQLWSLEHQKIIKVMLPIITHIQVFTIQMLPIITASLHKAVQLQETGRAYKSTSAKEMIISRNFTFESIITKISQKK